MKVNLIQKVCLLGSQSLDLSQAAFELKQLGFIKDTWSLPGSREKMNLTCFIRLCTILCRVSHFVLLQGDYDILMRAASKRCCEVFIGNNPLLYVVLENRQVFPSRIASGIIMASLTCHWFGGTPGYGEWKMMDDEILFWLNRYFSSAVLTFPPCDRDECILAA